MIVLNDLAFILIGALAASVFWWTRRGARLTDIDIARGKRQRLELRRASRRCRSV